ncbi:MAG: rhodanese-like domain-containing protein [Gammaproteobacteria bacterium]|jgi:rhodanese-related sulfurtransferase
MKGTIKILSACLLMSFCMHVQAEEIVPNSIPGTTKISAEQLINLAQTKPSLIIIDSRKPSDHFKGHIEGSINLPDTETTPETLSKHIPTKSTPVIFYCNGIRCGRSAAAAKVAVAAGYTKIYWFRGGWGEWTAKGYPAAR